ncbi:hypothetical protein ACC791_37075, partial [Rhizobium ruizarguesonis]
NLRLGGEDFVHTGRRLPQQSSDIDDFCFREPVQPARQRYGHAASEEGEAAEQPVLSGESDRIGTRNFDDDTPFGERVAII